jgi:methyl-accepting chemotaxis protein
MFSSNQKTNATLQAVRLSQALIEFSLDGTILDANDVFLSIMGYTLDEIKGKKHQIFLTKEEQNSADYARFWQALNRGEAQVAEFRRIAKNGDDKWLQASYSPILGRNGKPTKVIKFCMDVTEQKKLLLDYQGQVTAIERSQAMIQFSMDGSILTANKTFLDLMGYSLDEIRGKKHSMFVKPENRETQEYRQFWADLNNGQHKTNEFERVGKGGKSVWIMGSYNPILDCDGRPIKVVKFATDVTKAVADRVRRRELHRDIDMDLGQITVAVSGANTQAKSAADASTHAYHNVQGMVTGAEDLAASVSEISRQVSAALNISSQAVSQAERTSQIVNSLSTAADRIGEVVKLINDIASQTNLLALNATIEAARAGEAGKGFAVVANEVKTLANQTAKATNDIAEQINTVQAVTLDAVEATKSIATTIGEINGISAAIAAAVEEQSAVTRNISTNMKVAADEVRSTTQNVSDISGALNQIDQTTGKVKKDSSRLFL